MLFAVLSIASITGIYLRQVTRAGVLGLIGYLVLAAGFLLMLATEIIGAVVIPAVAATSPGYVTDVLAVAVPGGQATGDIGLMSQLSPLGGVSYLAGGLLFGIALFRARVLARWAAALLAVGSVATLAIPLLPRARPWRRHPDLHPGHRPCDLRHQHTHHRPWPRCRLGHQPRRGRVRHPATPRPQQERRPNQQPDQQPPDRALATAKVRSS